MFRWCTTVYSFMLPGSSDRLWRLVGDDVGSLCQNWPRHVSVVNVIEQDNNTNRSVQAPTANYNWWHGDTRVGHSGAAERQRTLRVYQSQTAPDHRVDVNAGLMNHLTAANVIVNSRLFLLRGFLCPCTTFFKFDNLYSSYHGSTGTIKEQ